MKGIPIPVWILTVYFLAGSIFILFVYFAYLLTGHGGSFMLDTAASNYGVIEYGLVLGKQFLVIVAAVFLFRLKKLALKLFLTVLLVVVVSLGWFSFKAGTAEYAGLAALVNMAIGLGFWSAVCVYVRRLVKNGTLK
ncbi:MULTISPECIES: hypothetical protein [unclassified Pseudomonas]|uniref:hypothetical protein n=1 Tax=unclassified Pseudomonas TaxID=196821 RepID=UPI0024478FC9|nr:MULTISPECIES: hypothetical protein [unclassified Pseudomonas]MDG9926996.1 hypothetical protein [Pseudomonas sp. GD04042]MDH0485907.1 hypothetical protein [Pseudomonas sp. GD04015]MDH0602411.1 hypothetical protein [Pseudomonas sp. GD03869]